MAKESPARKVLRIGHRGAAGHAPENTLASIAQAVALGCDLSEVDVRRTADGYPILLHDDLQHLRRADPDASTMALFKKLLKDLAAEAARLQATHVGLRFDKATAPLVKALHKAGSVVFVYIIN
jgi:glycerophosphoryl diester phosphodiesterase